MLLITTNYDKWQSVTFDCLMTVILSVTSIHHRPYLRSLFSMFYYYCLYYRVLCVCLFSLSPHVFSMFFCVMLFFLSAASVCSSVSRVLVWATSPELNWLIDWLIDTTALRPPTYRQRWQQWYNGSLIITRYQWSVTDARFTSRLASWNKCVKVAVSKVRKLIFNHCIIYRCFTCTKILRIAKTYERI